jgi:Delta6-protoilludene synthase
MSNLLQFSLPDPVARWPWPRKLNRHYQQVKPESDSWIRGFEALDAQSQRSFDLCNFREHVLRPLFSVIAELDI